MKSGPQSGKFGVIHSAGVSIEHMFDWTLNPTMTPEVRYHSGSRVGADRAAGVEDWTANFTMYSGYNAFLLPGRFIEIDMFTAPDNGVYGSMGTIYYGRCVIDSIAITWTWNPNASLQMVCSVSGDGCYAAKHNVIDDIRLTSPDKMCNISPPLWSLDGNNWQQFQNINTMTLTLISANQTFVNSSTCCGTGRQDGNIDWTLTMTEQETGKLFAEGGRFWIRLPVDGVNIWELKRGMFINYSNLRVDRQTGIVISKDMNWAMDGLIDQDLGHIMFGDPGGTPTTLWPPTPVSGPTIVITDLAAAGGANIGLTWTSTGEVGVTTERVYRATDCCGPYIYLDDASGPGAYTDSAVVSGQTYWYKVTSTDGTVETQFSNIASATAS